MDFFSKRIQPIDASSRFQTICYLAKSNRLSISRQTLLTFGRSGEIESYLMHASIDATAIPSSKVNKGPYQYRLQCLSGIVEMMLLEHREITEGKYKSIVNVVNQLGLSIVELDKAIKALSPKNRV